MLKVLFISNGIDIERGAFEFVKEMNRRVPVFLYEVFLPKRSPGDWLLRADSLFLLPPYKSQTQERLVMAACRFSDLCREYDIRHSSYLGKGEAPVSKLENESRYADLLVLGDALFQQRSTSYRWPHLAKILRYCEYLVIVVPDHFQFSNGNVIAFDGSASAVYALKQFSYLLPDLVANTTVLINVGLRHYKNERQNRSDLNNLAMNHYPSLDSAYLKLNTDLELTEWMAGQQSVIRIVGACGRSWGAQLVIKSFISVLLKDKGVPLFAAHR